MDAFAFIGFVLLTVAAGVALLSVCVGARAMHPAALLGLSWTLGSGGVSAGLLLISLAGRAPDRASLLAAGLLSVLVLVFRSSKIPRPQRLPDRGINGKFNVLLFGASIALIAVAITSVAVQSRLPGLADTDSYAIWILKAKVVATLPLRPIPLFFSNPTLSFSHQDYPPAFPLLIVALHAATQWPLESCAKALLVPNFLALVLVAFGSVRSILDRPMAMGLTAAFISGSVVLSLAATAEAELPLLLMHTASLYLMWRWMRDGARGWLVAAGAAAAFAAMTKNEGLALMPILGIACVAFAFLRRSKKLLVDTIWAGALSVLIALPWLIYRSHLPHTHEDYGGKLASGAIAHLGQLQLIVSTFFGQPMRVGSVGFFWLLLPLAAAVGWRGWRRADVLAMWFVLLAHTVLYVLVFLVTPWDLPTLLPMVSAKLVMHISPAALLLIALHTEAAGGGFPSIGATAKTPAMAEPLRD